MTRAFRKILLATTVAAAVFAPSVALAQDEQTFAEAQYRKDVMQHFNLSIKKILQNFQGNVQHPEHYAAIADIMANAATLSKAAFEKDTRSMEGPTKAKAEIWDNWEDFSGRMDKLVEDTAAFAEAAKSGDMGQIQPGFRRAVSQCKACHDLYKAE